MAEITNDPVHKARYTFEPEGDDLIVETWLAPGGALPPHMHPRQTERWEVLEGEIELRLGKKKRVIQASDGAVLVPPDTVHGLANKTASEAHLRCHVSPAFGLQAFLEESAAAARDGLFMRGGIPKSPRGARWVLGFLARYNEDVVMSFPPRFVQRLMVALAGNGATSPRPDSLPSARSAAGG